jgi:hypothetical protein
MIQMDDPKRPGGGRSVSTYMRNMDHIHGPHTPLSSNRLAPYQGTEIIN